MYTCFHSVGLPKLPVLDLMNRVRGSGYKAIELSAETLPWAEPHVTPATSPAERQAIVEAVTELGLKIPAVGAHIEMVGSDATQREAAIQFVKGCTDLAKDLNSSIVHILSGPVAAGSDKAEAIRWFTEAVAETVDYAERGEIQIGVEAIAGHAFNCVDDYHQLSRDLPGSKFYVNFDPSHLEVQGETRPGWSTNSLTASTTCTSRMEWAGSRTSASRRWV